MRWYRVIFCSLTGAILGRDEFQAGSDCAAMAVAEQLWDACSDVAEGFELWDGVRRVDESFSKMPSPTVSADQIARMSQISLLRREVAMSNSYVALARSQRLLKRISELEREP